MSAHSEEFIIRHKIVDIIDHDKEVQKNEELMNIFRTAYLRRDKGKPMREVALALDKALAGYIASHNKEKIPDSVLDLHREMFKLSDI